MSPWIPFLYQYSVGGLRSVHAKAGPPAEADGVVLLPRSVLETSTLLVDRPVRVEKML